MKNALRFTLPFALLIASSSFADDITKQQPITAKPKQENNYAHASLDFDIFWAPVSLDNYYPAYNESGQQIGRYRVQEKQSSQYEGVRVTWEWLEPNFLYGALNLWFAGGNIHNKASVNDVKVDDRHTSSNLWINKDFALGYNYKPSPNSGFLLSVFAGLGDHYEKKYQKKVHWEYAMAGLKMTQDLTKSLSLGVDFKTMYSYHVWDRYNVTYFERKGENQFWGIELGTPLTWHIGKKRQLDLKVRPYLFKFNINSNATMLGTTIGVGYTY